MKAGQSQEKKKEKVTTLLPTMSESKLCEKRGGRERERGKEGGEREWYHCIPRIICSCTLCSLSVEAIEVLDTVVVSAFGRPIPVMKPRLPTKIDSILKF